MGEQEKRWAKRLVMDARIKLNSIRGGKALGEIKQDAFDVDVVNISKGGMAFTTDEILPLNSYYDVHVVLWSKDSFEAVIEVIRMEREAENDKILYGCKFIGLCASDQFKIDVYQIVSESKEEE